MEHPKGRLTVQLSFVSVCIHRMKCVNSHSVYATMKAPLALPASILKPFCRLSWFPHGLTFSTSSRRKPLEIRGTGFFAGWMSLSPGQWYQMPTGVLASSFLHPPSDCRGNGIVLFILAPLHVPIAPCTLALVLLLGHIAVLHRCSLLVPME